MAEVSQAEEEGAMVRGTEKSRPRNGSQITFEQRSKVLLLLLPMPKKAEPLLVKDFG